MRPFALLFMSASLMLGGALSPSMAQRDAARDKSAGSPSPAVGTMPEGETVSDWRASKLIGSTMTNTLGETIGKVNDVVIDTDGKVSAVLVSVGGFLGLGETEVAIGPRHLVISLAEADTLDVRTSLSRTAIEQAANVDLDPVQPPVPTR